MRTDINELEKVYRSIFQVLESISSKLEKQLQDIFGKVAHVDRIICRVKSLDSFLKKCNKLKNDGDIKYTVPIREIQDMIGARIVVYYKTDVQPIREIVLKYFQRVEELMIIPDDVSKFGYEGFHVVCFIPNTLFAFKENPQITNFFEIQVKTLFQHAWSQSNHGLGYKPGTELTADQQRMLAFIAAQSWGADKALSELVPALISMTSH